MRRWMMAAAMASALVAFKCELQGAYTRAELASDGWQKLPRHWQQEPNEDVVVLQDGTQVKGKIVSLPQLRFSFGAVTIAPDELASLSVRQAFEPKLRLTTRQGFVYAADIPSEKLVVLLEDQETGHTFKKKMALEDISLVISRQEGSFKKTPVSTGFYTLKLKNGDMFPISMQADTIVVSDGFQETQIGPDQIVDLHVNGGVYGVIQDPLTRAPCSLDLVFIRDKYFSFVTADYFQSVKMPWDIIARIEKIPQRNINLQKLQAERLRKELSTRTPAYSESDQNFFSAGITKASIKGLIAVSSRSSGLSQNDGPQFKNSRRYDDEDSQEGANEEFSEYFSTEKRKTSPSGIHTSYNVIPQPSLGKAGLGVIKEEPGQTIQYHDLRHQKSQEDEWNEDILDRQKEVIFSRNAPSRKEALSAQIALADLPEPPPSRLGSAKPRALESPRLQEGDRSPKRTYREIPSKFAPNAEDFDSDTIDQISYLAEGDFPDYRYEKGVGKEILPKSHQNMIYVADELLPAPSKRWKALEIFLLPNSTLLPSGQQPILFVKVPAFYIDQSPVTNEQYQRFAHETSHPTPKNWSNGLIPKSKEKEPVTNITYRDAEAYAKWAGKRLPTEVELARAYRSSPQFREGQARISEWTASTVAVEAQNSGERYWNRVHPNQNRLSNFRVVKVQQNQQNLPVEENKEHPLIGFRCLKDI